MFYSEVFFEIIVTEMRKNHRLLNVVTKLKEKKKKKIDEKRDPGLVQFRLTYKF